MQAPMTRAKIAFLLSSYLGLQYLRCPKQYTEIMRNRNLKALLLVLLVCLAGRGAWAQEAQPDQVQPAVQEEKPFKFGYLSYNAVFQAMPEYAVSQQKLAELKEKYDRETRRSEDEFQRKFAEFLQGQKDFPENILLKRQNELQDLLQQSVKFKEEARRLLTEAEKEMQQSMLFLLDEAIRAVGTEQGFAFILNTDGRACPFVSLTWGTDVTNLVREKLQIPLTIQP